MPVKIIECPRDAMQGLSFFIPTETKVEYLNALLQVGYHTLDCGSFVSPKAIPQMADTAEVIRQLEPSDTRLSVIVANRRGAKDALAVERVNYLGFPFSISETFQHRNTRKSIAQSVYLVKDMAEWVDQAGKEMVIYISMGFGNPYNDPWSSNLVVDWVGKLAEIGLTSFSISDTVGVSKPETIEPVYRQLIASFPNCEFGAHFHTRPDNWLEKVDSAFRNGCKRFDGAIAGFGGCPMAKDDLVGNMPTESLVEYFKDQNMDTGLDEEQFKRAMLLAAQVFG